MSESKFKKKVMRDLGNIPDSFFYSKEAGTIRGLPDIVGLIAGRYVALELKKSASEARKTTGRIALQRYTLKKIRNAGGYAAIAHPDNWEEVLRELQSL